MNKVIVLLAFCVLVLSGCGESSFSMKGAVGEKAVKAQAATGATVLQPEAITAKDMNEAAVTGANAVNNGFNSASKIYEKAMDDQKTLMESLSNRFMLIVAAIVVVLIAGLVLMYRRSLQQPIVIVQQVPQTPVSHVSIESPSYPQLTTSQTVRNPATDDIRFGGFLPPVAPAARRIGSQRPKKNQKLLPASVIDEVVDGEARDV